MPHPIDSIPIPQATTPRARRDNDPSSRSGDRNGAPACPSCGAKEPAMLTKTMAVCPRCNAGIDDSPRCGIQNVYPPHSYEMMGPGQDVIQGDIHYCSWTERWYLDYPIHEEGITTDNYPLIARKTSARSINSGEQLTLF